MGGGIARRRYRIHPDPPRSSRDLCHNTICKAFHSSKHNEEVQLCRIKIRRIPRWIKSYSS